MGKSKNTATPEAEVVTPVEEVVETATELEATEATQLELLAELGVDPVVEPEAEAPAEPAPAPEPTIVYVPAEGSLSEQALAMHPDVGSNIAMVVWPTDTWGLTKDLKEAIAYLGSRISGADDKKELVDATLSLALAALEAKFQSDRKIRLQRLHGE